MKLEEIGFYTLSDARAATASHLTPVSRCEIVLTSRCNFKCKYCRNVGGPDMDYMDVCLDLAMMSSRGVKAIRFSGGEPTLYDGLDKLCMLAKRLKVNRIALSTNGSADTSLYEHLIDCGVNDFSISLDACCAEDVEFMNGGIKGSWEKIIHNIEHLSKKSYTTVGIVLTENNMAKASETIQFAYDLGVYDIRIIPAAQEGESLCGLSVKHDILRKCPILAYRVQNIMDNKSVRGLRKSDSDRCGLVIDDIAINHEYHYPCIIYMRESGRPIGKVGLNMYNERLSWFLNHDTHCDKICSKNCLDVCVDYNNSFSDYNEMYGEIR
jgi:MoaA/NifB/PqqE/SkfB family radical SAM enzyme